MSLPTKFPARASATVIGCVRIRRSGSRKADALPAFGSTAPALIRDAMTAGGRASNGASARSASRTAGVYTSRILLENAAANLERDPVGFNPRL